MHKNTLKSITVCIAILLLAVGYAGATNAQIRDGAANLFHALTVGSSGQLTVDASGNLATTGVVTQNGANLAGTAYNNQSFQNIVVNSDYESWSAGTSAAPDGWTISGTGAAIARSADEKLGTYAANLTYGSANVFFSQLLDDYGNYAGLNVTARGWVKTDTASIGLIQIYDGSTTTSSDYHTGGGGWELLTVTHTVEGTPTQLGIRGRVLGAGSVIFDGIALTEGNTVPAWSPHPNDWMYNDPNGNGTSSNHTIYTGALPGIDNRYAWGDDTKRWSVLRGATGSFGDLEFANDFSIVESYSDDEIDGIPRLYFINNNGKTIAALTQNGDYEYSGILKKRTFTDNEYQRFTQKNASRAFDTVNRIRAEQGKAVLDWEYYTTGNYT